MNPQTQPTPAELAQIAAPILAARCTFDAKSDIAWAVAEAYLLWKEAQRFCEEQRERAATTLDKSARL